MPDQTIARQSVVDLLADRLRDDILDGTHPTGALLPPERDLAARYGVTRTTLKHALTRLEQAGLLQTRTASAPASATSSATAAPTCCPPSPPTTPAG